MLTSSESSAASVALSSSSSSSLSAPLASLSLNAIESYLPADLKQLFEQDKTRGFREIEQTLEVQLKAVRASIDQVAEANYDQIGPIIERNEAYQKKVHSMQTQINAIKSDLSQQENLLQNVSEIDEYKNLIGHIELINKILTAIKSFQEFESNLRDLKVGVDNKNYRLCSSALRRLTHISETCELFGKRFEIPCSNTTNYSSSSSNNNNNNSVETTNSNGVDDDVVAQQQSAVASELLIVRELSDDLTVLRERLWFELDQEWDRMLQVASSGSSDARVLIDTSRTSQTLLDELAQFAHFKQHPQSLQSQQSASRSSSNSFVFMSRMKQFSRHFLQLCQLFILNETGSQSNGTERLDEKTSNAANTTLYAVEVTNDPVNDKLRILHFRAVTRSGTDASKQQSSSAATENVNAGTDDDDDDVAASSSRLLDFKLRQIEAFLRFLYENLFGLSVLQENSSSSSNGVDRSPKLMGIFADLVLADFVKLIYERLIVNVIPVRRYDARVEAAICERVAEFEAELVRLEFLDSNSSKTKSSSKSSRTSSSRPSAFRSFVGNVEELYVRKKCQSVMEAGRELLKDQQQLFELVRIDERTSAADRLACDAKTSVDVQTSSSSSGSNRRAPQATAATTTLAALLVTFEQETSDTATAATAAATRDQRRQLDQLGLLRMPVCSVSRACKRLLDMAYATLNEALAMTHSPHSPQTSQTPNARNISLMCLVARNLFDLYAAVVPTQHAAALRDLPLLAAVVHNDLAYLAFHCLTLTHQYRQLFLELRAAKCSPATSNTNLNNEDDNKSGSNSNINSNNSNNCNNNRMVCLDYMDLEDIIGNFSCLDLIPALCAQSGATLARQLERQHANLLQFLNEDTNGVRDLSDKDNYELLRRALLKCARQLSSLAAVWAPPVLSTGAYCRIFGTLLDFVCNNLLRAVLNLEDISSDDASYLHSAFTVVKQNGFALFARPQADNSRESGSSSNDISSSNVKKKENTHADEQNAEDDLSNISFSNSLADLNASKYVKSWQRFNYLMVLLKANLQEIADLWSDGKGVLAVYFEAEEVRHLIRALFMITEKRSAILARIK